MITSRATSRDVTVLPVLVVGSARGGRPISSAEASVADTPSMAQGPRRDHDTVGPQDVVDAEATRVGDFTSGCSGTTSRSHRSRWARAGSRGPAVEVEGVEELDGPLVFGRRTRAPGRPTASRSAGVGERGAERALAHLLVDASVVARRPVRATPPPAHCGDRMEPCRARPVPFWRQGFRPPPATSPRVFVLCVPERIRRDPRRPPGASTAR